MPPSTSLLGGGEKVSINHYLHGVTILVFEMGQMMGILMNSVEMAKGLVSSIKKFEMILILVSFGSMKLVLFNSETRVVTETESIVVQNDRITSKSGVWQRISRYRISLGNLLRELICN